MFDLIIKNGWIFDGTGNAPYKADVGIRQDKICTIKQGIVEDNSCVTINAQGRYVVPGFIDPHTHVDQSVLMAPQMEPYLKQGVTTVVTGNCGLGMAPQGKEFLYYSDMNLKFLEIAGADPDNLITVIFDKEKGRMALKERYDIDLDWVSFEDFNKKCEELPLGCNMAPLAGYSALRTAVMGNCCLQSANEDELSALEAALEKCMKEGAFGLSTGRDPVYIPGVIADDAEMNRMFKIVAAHDGIVTSHTYNFDRDGKIDRFSGYDELIRQAEGTDVKLNISHVHVNNMAGDRDTALKMAERTLKYFEKYRNAGFDLTYDVIPSSACADYTMKSFGYFIKPLVRLAGTRKRLAGYFKDPAFRESVHMMVQEGKLPTLDMGSQGCWLKEFLVLKHQNPAYMNKSMIDVADKLNLSPLDTMMKIFSEDPDMIADMVAPDFSEAADLLCKNAYAMPCSDGSSFSKETNVSGNDEMPLYPNSMNVSYIPRYLVRYGKESDASFAHAVKQASGFVAQRFGIAGRGFIREGYFADLAILNVEKLRSFDEEAEPLRDPEGIEYVIVNGRIAVVRNCLKDISAGKVLRKKI